jgi:polygalacturonase
MSVSGVCSTPTAPITQEKLEGPGPDNDGDADDGAAVQAPVQAAPAPGTGTVVDTSA